MSTVSFFGSENLQELQQFLKSTSFSRAIRVGVAVTLPVIVGIQFGYIEVGIAVTYGAYWCSPSDVNGNFQHKKVGILISVILVMIVSLIGGYMDYESWLSLPVLGVLSFLIAYFSVYGFRASLISFSGLLALILSFAHESAELKIYQYAMLIGLGGLWYLLLVKIWYRINPKAETEEFLAETYRLTADFIETRGKLIGSQEIQQQLQSELRNLQSQLTENHQNLREILILSRKTSGLSRYQDKRLLIFVQLVEMLETAVANPVNYGRMDALFNDHPQYIIVCQDLVFKMAHQLRMIAQLINDKQQLPDSDDIKRCIADLKLKIAQLRETSNYEAYLMLQNFLEYQEKQFEKIKRIKWIYGDPDAVKIDDIDRNSTQYFVAPQDYNPRLLVRNFSFKSTIFRHSFRLAVTIMIGYVLGSLFAFQNSHWILLTIIVIMRPNYGLTRSRATDRIIGTFIGGAIATVLVFLIRDPYVYGAVSVVALVISISMVQKNYKASAIFITLSVVFIYAILYPDALTGIKFRILDTLVGAGLSYLAMLLLWPTWEFVEINESIKKSVKANQDFLIEITEFYQQKGDVPTSYKVARKQAFLETSNLNSAFQRMAQEPKSKQKEMDEYYELVVLNHTFLASLASLASLSTYIQQHKTSDASDPFRMATDKITKKLEGVIQCLDDKVCDEVVVPFEIDTLIEEQLPAFNSLTFKNLSDKDDQNVRDLQEAHLIWEQLRWLFSLSGKMIKLAVPLNQG